MYLKHQIPKRKKHSLRRFLSWMGKTWCETWKKWVEMLQNENEVNLAVTTFGLNEWMFMNCLHFLFFCSWWMGLFLWMLSVVILMKIKPLVFQWFKWKKRVFTVVINEGGKKLNCKSDNNQCMCHNKDVCCCIYILRKKRILFVNCVFIESVVWCCSFVQNEAICFNKSCIWNDQPVEERANGNYISRLWGPW